MKITSGFSTKKMWRQQKQFDSNTKKFKIKKILTANNKKNSQTNKNK